MEYLPATTRLPGRCPSLGERLGLRPARCLACTPGLPRKLSIRSVRMLSGFNVDSVRLAPSCTPTCVPRRGVGSSSEGRSPGSRRAPLPTISHIPSFGPTGQTFLFHPPRPADRPPIFAPPALVFAPSSGPISRRERVGRSIAERLGGMGTPRKEIRRAPGAGKLAASPFRLPPGGALPDGLAAWERRERRFAGHPERETRCVPVPTSSDGWCFLLRFAVAHFRAQLLANGGTMPHHW
jgi:hypothetical protein